jgi:membrane protein required for colicin V production
VISITGLGDWHVLDGIMLAILLVSVLVGAWRGLIFELMSLAGWVVAYVAAMAFSSHLGPLLPIGEAGSALNSAAAVVACFLLVLLAWGLLARLVRLLVAATPLTAPDRFLGALFGSVRGLVILVVFATIVALTPASQSPWWQASRGVQWLGVVVDGLRPWLPPAVTRWLPARSLTVQPTV